MKSMVWCVWYIAEDREQNIIEGKKYINQSQFSNVWVDINAKFCAYLQNLNAEMK